MKNSKFHFLKSVSSNKSHGEDTSSVLQWLKEQNEKAEVQVERIALNKMKHWDFERRSGFLRHDSGGFFSIDGIRVATNWGRVETWDQPIINQPEVGYLGFIVKEFNGVLHFLMQAKIEPGNVNHVQLSPTIQATRSNYTQVHQGAKPLYLEYFQHVAPRNVLLDQLQSEQGARFLMKRNRNIIIRVECDIPIYDNFIWLTLGHIKELMRYNNLINMDTRTVVSGIHYGQFSDEVADVLGFFMNRNVTEASSSDFLKSALSLAGAENSIDDIIHFLTNIKSKYDIFVDKIPLNMVKDWSVSPDEISRQDGKYFKVIGVNVTISNREVVSWQQPMIQPAQLGICAFVCKKINGVIHFIVQAKLECGNRDIIELAPTVQCLTGDYDAADSEPVPFLAYVLSAAKENILLDALQSEEGGRFYREQNRNVIVLADDTFPNQLPEQYIWMTLNQLTFFNRFNNYLNIQVRSLMAAISFT
ncbi:NDP-hexose 2,3-dehydratase family protein [Amylibacter sp.]|nr:NDP-hexose 2,3-dehydratase family protein [Amylibacter sp.]